MFILFSQLDNMELTGSCNMCKYMKSIQNATHHNSFAHNEQWVINIFNCLLTDGYCLHLFFFFFFSHNKRLNYMLWMSLIVLYTHTHNINCRLGLQLPHIVQNLWVSIYDSAKSGESSNSVCKKMLKMKYAYSDLNTMWILNYIYVLQLLTPWLNSRESWLICTLITSL